MRASYCINPDCKAIIRYEANAEVIKCPFCEKYFLASEFSRQEVSSDAVPASQDVTEGAIAPTVSNEEKEALKALLSQTAASWVDLANIREYLSKAHTEIQGDTQKILSGQQAAANTLESIQKQIDQMGASINMVVRFFSWPKKPQEKKREPNVSEPAPISSVGESKPQKVKKCTKQRLWWHRSLRRGYKPVVISDGNRTIALKRDGTIILTDRNPAAKYSENEWKSIKQLAASNGAFVGLSTSGHVVLSAQLKEIAGIYTDLWHDIVAVAYDGDDVIGLKADGSLLLQNTHIGALKGGRYGDRDMRRHWHNIVAIEAKDGLTIGITKDGKVVASSNGKVVDIASEWEKIQAVSIGSRSNLLALKNDGRVETSLLKYGAHAGANWKNIVAIAAGPDFCIGLRKNGTVIAAGKNTYGQCNVSSWKNIVAIAAGIDYVIGVDRNGRVLTTGRNEKGQRNVSSWNLLESSENTSTNDSPIVYSRNYETGGIVPLGAYIQSAKSNACAAPIEWQVLYRGKDRVLLISRHVLDCQPLHSISKNVTWEKSNLRSWLNEAFLNAAFTAEEQGAILPAVVDSTPYQPENSENKNQRDCLSDKVFLLSQEEADKYFPNVHTRQAVPTEFAESRGASVHGSNECCSWLLRPSGMGGSKVFTVTSDGEYQSTRAEGKHAVRPAIWISPHTDILT